MGESIGSGDMSMNMLDYSAATYSEGTLYYPTNQYVTPLMDFHGYRPYMPTEVVTGRDGPISMLPPSPSQSPESSSHLRPLQPALSPERLIRPKNRPAFPSQLLRSQSAGNMRYAAVSSEFGLPKRVTSSDKERAGRKKGLSLEQKRAMCRLHDKHPTMRQADIGQIFGVDRSTVSKVLRRRDLQLGRESEPNSVGAKSVLARYPGIEGVLSTYVLQHRQQRGFEVSDTQLLEQIRIFANDQDDESILSVIGEDWLDGFKLKHAIGTHPRRRASEPSMADRVHSPPPALPTPLAYEAQAAQPTNQEPTPGAATFGAGFDGSSPPSAQAQPPNPSDTAGPLSSDGMSSDEGSSSNPERLVKKPSSDSPLTHSPSKTGHRLRRSKTISFGNVAYGPTSSFGSDKYPSQLNTIEPRVLELTPDMLDSQMASPQALYKACNFPKVAPQPYTTPGSTPSLDATPDDQCLPHPSQEDACRAANTLLTYLQSMSLLGNFEPEEYLAVLKLSKKLQEPCQFPQTFFAMPPPMGGLGDIPESETAIM